MQMPPATGGALAVVGGAIERVATRADAVGWRELGGAWVRLPGGATPWGAVHFVGGAALGIAPQVVYDKLLTEICERAQVAVIAVPYSPDRDHDRIAKQARLGGTRDNEDTGHCWLEPSTINSARISPRVNHYPNLRCFKL